jgi:hypothetical protein
MAAQAAASAGTEVVLVLQVAVSTHAVAVIGPVLAIAPVPNSSQ